MVMRTPQEHIETLGSGIDDTLAPSSHDASAIDLKTTIDYMASQVADILGEVNWYNPPDKTIAALAAQATLEATLAETEAYLLTDITVGNGDNFKLLVVASNEVPAVIKAIATSQVGLVTALHDGTFATTHSLAELSGDTTINPRNLLQVVDGATGDPILSSGKVIWGLLQHETGATDGALFTDTTPQRSQVSFVRVNATNDDLEACPVADIEDKVVNISFVNRKTLSTRVAQDWMRRGSFVDVPTGAAAVTLNNAIDNQGATPATQATDISVRIDDDSSWSFDTSDGGVKLLEITPAAAGDQIQVNVDTLDVNVGAAGTIDFDNGATVDSGGTPINLGVTGGQIDAGAAALKVASSGAAVEIEGVGVTLDGLAGADGPITVDGTLLDADFYDSSHLDMRANDAATKTLRLLAANDGAGVSVLDLSSEDGDMRFQTVRETTPLPLDDSTAGAISGLTGGPHASVSAAILYAMSVGGVDLGFKRFVLASNYAKDVNVPAATLDLSAYTLDMTPGPASIFLFLQGRMIDGAGAADEGDVYPGTTPASGDVKFSYPGGVKSGWILHSIGLKA
jgi:hypothetical protein